MVIALLFLSVVDCLVTEPPFVELDRKLHDEMTAPQEVAENTFRMLLSYYIQMYDMYRSFRSGNDSYSEMVNELKSQGGPLLTTAFVDGKTLHYDALHTELLKKFLNTIDQFWAMIVKKAGAVETLMNG
uniref:Uncharacterized protein n=1 Tax=Graphocephala atropunctata TaxID=36148 RepID=A0A1B6MF54_9HEMI